MLLRRIMLVFTVVFTVTFALAACGAGEQAEPSGEQTSAPAQPGATATVDPPAANQPQPDPAATTPGGNLAEPEPAGSLPSGPLYTVQIAAYEESSEATRLESFLTQQGLPAWTTTAQVDGRTVHRVRIGALPELGMTRQLGADLAQRYRADVWIAPIEARDAVPAGAVDATRAIVPSR